MNRSPDAAAGPVARLPFNPPYDWGQVLAFLARRAVPSVEQVSTSAYRRVVGHAGNECALRVELAPDAQALQLTLDSPATAVSDSMRWQVRDLFDLDTHPRDIVAVLSRDPVLAPSVRARPGIRVPGAWDGFELAVRAVLGQQISVAGASTLARRLVDALGEPRLHSRDGLERCFPTPERLADADLAGIGLTRARANTVRALARAVADRRLVFAASQTLDEFVERAVALPGIGPWTAHYIAMRALRHADAFPAADLIVRQRLGQGSPVSAREAERRSQAWRPFRAYAVLHLWNS